MEQNKTCWTVKNKSDESAEILFYGDIESASAWSEGNNTSDDFAAVLGALNGKNITLRINSPGGDVFEAQAIYNLLKAYKGKISAHIDGICASAATLVACAAEKITMPANSLFMIHNPSCYLMDGYEAGDLRKTADMLDSVKDCILNVYLSKTKGKLDENAIRQMMDEETWMTSEEALKNGFIDEVDDFGIQASMKAGMMVVNGISMPTIRKRQEELVNLMRKEEPMSTENDGIIDKIKAALKEMGIGEQKAEEPAPVSDEERLQALDALKGKGVYADAIIEKAKADGKTVDDVAGFVEALAAIQPEPIQKAPKKEPAKAALGDIISDQMASGADGVAPAMAADKEAEKVQQKVSDMDNIVNFVNTMIRK